MLAALSTGEDDPEILAQMARGRLRVKLPDLERALRGQLRESHRLLLTLHLEHIDELNVKLDQLQAAIEQRMTAFDEDDLIERLCTIPGVSRKVAQIIVAELGTDMSCFPRRTMPLLGRFSPWPKRKCRSKPFRQDPKRQPLSQGNFGRGCPRRWKK